MSDAHWTRHRIGDCVESSFAGEWGSEPTPANAVVLRATDIDDDGHVIGTGAARSIPRAKLRAKRLRDGDILLEGSGGGPGKPVGRVALFDASAHASPAICSNFFKTLRPKRDVVDERFLWRKLGWFYSQPALLALQQQTTGIINLKFREYLDAGIEVPSDRSEQKKIAQVLDTLDTTIRQTEAIIEKLKQVKQGLLHDLLTRGINANGELRPPQAQAPHLYKQSPLGWIPKEWDTGPLSLWLTGKPKNGYSPPPAGQWTGVQMLGLGCLTPTGFQPRQMKDAPIGDPLLRSAILVPGDLLMSRANTRELVGLVGIYQDVGTTCCYPDLMMRLTPSPQVSAAFLELVLSAPRSRRQIQASASGTSSSMVKISSPVVMTLCVSLPKPEEQARILENLEASEHRTNLEVQFAEKLRAQKSGLMDDLLTGRVRVTPLLEPTAP